MGGITEAGWQRQIVELAELLGWSTMHVRRSVVREGRWATATSTAGWPDLVLWRPGSLLFVEVKTDVGRVTSDQRAVLDSLAAAGAEVHVWRPRDFDDVETRLRVG